MVSPQRPNEVSYILRRDENGWKAEAHSFQDPVLSPVGFGDKKEEAVENLKSQPQLQQMLQRYGKPLPDLGDFTSDASSEKEMTANLQREYGYIPSGPERTTEEPARLEPRNIKPRR